MSHKIYTTGAYLESIQCIINNKKQWRWVVTSFEEDSFSDGKCIDPLAYGDSENRLLEGRVD